MFGLETAEGLSVVIESYQHIMELLQSASWGLNPRFRLQNIIPTCQTGCQE